MMSGKEAVILAGHYFVINKAVKRYHAPLPYGAN